MRGKSVLQRHPTAAFFTLVIGWSYLFWFFLFQALPLEAGEGPTLLHILLGGLGGSPSLMALLFSYRIGGKQELRDTIAVLWFFAGAVLVVSRARTTLRSYPLN